MADIADYGRKGQKVVGGIAGLFVSKDKADGFASGLASGVSLIPGAEGVDTSEAPSPTASQPNKADNATTATNGTGQDGQHPESPLLIYQRRLQEGKK